MVMFLGPVPHVYMITLRCFDLEGKQVYAWPSRKYGFEFVEFIFLLGPATRFGMADVLVIWYGAGQRDCAADYAC